MSLKWAAGHYQTGDWPNAANLLTHPSGGLNFSAGDVAEQKQARNRTPNTNQQLRLRIPPSLTRSHARTMISHISSTCNYPAHALTGFSLGGNLTLKYLGERGPDLDPRMKATAAFSIPRDLQTNSTHAHLTSRTTLRIGDRGRGDKPLRAPAGRERLARSL
jgi:dienelactone hydrolase